MSTIIILVLFTNEIFLSPYAIGNEDKTCVVCVLIKDMLNLNCHFNYSRVNLTTANI